MQTPNVSEIPKDVIFQTKTKLARCTLVYMSGAIAKILLKSTTFKNCSNCKRNLFVRHDATIADDFIEARQYKHGNLLRPGQYLTFLITHALNSLFYLIPRICTVNGISKVLASVLEKNLSFKVINCKEHNLGDKLCQIIIRCALFWWCKHVNKIARGTDTKLSKFLSTNPNKNYINPIKLQAYIKHQNSKKKCPTKL